jgi:hypothetical protein
MTAAGPTLASGSGADRWANQCLPSLPAPWWRTCRERIARERYRVVRHMLGRDNDGDAPRVKVLEQVRILFPALFLLTGAGRIASGVPLLAALDKFGTHEGAHDRGDADAKQARKGCCEAVRPGQEKCERNNEDHDCCDLREEVP